MAAWQQPVRAAGRGAGLHQPGLRPVRLSARPFPFSCFRFGCDWVEAPPCGRCTSCARSCAVCLSQSAPGHVLSVAALADAMSSYAPALCPAELGCASARTHTASDVLQLWSAGRQAAQMTRTHARTRRRAAAGAPPAAPHTTHAAAQVPNVPHLHWCPQLHSVGTDNVLPWRLGSRCASCSAPTATGSCTPPV